MVWLLIESNVLRKIVILPSSTLKVRPSIRWFHILSFTTLPSLKMGALPPWNPGCRFNQARYRGWSYPSASPPIHSHERRLLLILLPQNQNGCSCQTHEDVHWSDSAHHVLPNVYTRNYFGLYHRFIFPPTSKYFWIIIYKQQTSPRRITQLQSTVGSIRSP